MCVAAEIRAVNAQLADLYRHKEATHIQDTAGAVQECEMVMDVDLVGGDISAHGECQLNGNLTYGERQNNGHPERRLT